MRGYLFLLAAGLLGACSRPLGFGAGPPLRPVFDVPRLLSRNIDQLTRQLGPAALPEPEPTVQQLADQGNTWQRTFRRDSVTLVVTYHVPTRRVFHVFISTPHAGPAAYPALLQLGRVTGRERQLLVEPRLDLDGRWSQRGVWVGRRP